ncbi:hypothetical protein RB195_009567 [Necator americanus]|uniref:Uncharacterized protein n=1 Tax=Necator americanus TaxID=51031 RepID=A0ABR1CTW9_NECAM
MSGRVVASDLVTSGGTDGSSWALWSLSDGPGDVDEIEMVPIVNEDGDFLEVVMVGSVVVRTNAVHTLVVEVDGAVIEASHC